MIPVKPNNVTWTDDQWKAIHAQGQDILVAAAAGSGKTAVLIERLITKVKDQGVNVDELLVVTFTNAAAAEMRSRMATALEKAVIELEGAPTTPEVEQKRRTIRRQLSLIGKAQISTLHSFCLAICRQYAYMIDLDPGFRLASQDEVAILRDDVLMQVLESAYAGEAEQLTKEDVYLLVDSFTSDRHDTQIELLIEELYEMARVQPKPNEWLDQLPAAYDIAQDVTIDALPFVDDVKKSIEHQLLLAAQHYDSMRRLSELDAGMAPYVQIAMEEGGLVQVALEKLAESWQAACDCIREATFARMPTLKKGQFDEELKKTAQGHRDEAKDIINRLKSTYFMRDGHHLVEEIRKMKPIIQSLVQLTKVFSEAFKEAKLAKGIVDFSDLEHYALEILTERDEQGNLIPSAVAKEFQARFKEVLVDEYQDVNLLQEEILHFVKRGAEADGNLFMVGDVKQSIYAFRLAEPKLFLDKYERFLPEAQESGMRIDLNRNFRSRQEVLDSTNFIFSKVMDRAVGEIEYDEKASLKYGEGYEAVPRNVEAELVIFDEKNSGASFYEEEASEEESLAKSQREARYMIKRIEQMVGQEEIYDAKKKAMRKIEYRDIVILMRSMRWASDLAEEFKAAKIPLYAESSKGYFDALEVMIMMNVLKIVDNPLQDIPFVSVLRAPFIGVTENELADIRVAAHNVPFYQAVKQFLQKETGQMNSDTRRKLEAFMKQLEHWRDFARRGSLADLIWDIYEVTHYYEMVGTMANGKQRQANLRALHDRALAYEQTSFRGLFRFLRFIERMRSRGDDLGVAKSIGEGDNVVRLVTIHSSKGLEYPVVFVAGVSGRFNLKDFNSSYIFDQQFGIAVKAIDPEHRIVSTSLPFLALKEKKIAKVKAEEMRILYVAMTRAREKLILLGAVKNWDKTREAWQQFTELGYDEKLPDYVRASAQSYLDWIGPAVAGHEDYLTLSYSMNGSSAEVLKRSTWKVQICTDEDVRLQKEESGLTNVTYEPVDEAIVQSIEARFKAKYRYEQAVVTKSKTSVSEIKRLEVMAQTEQEETVSHAFRASSVAKQPSFMQERQMTGAEVGTVVHAVMQHVPQQGFANLEEANAFLQSLVARQILREREAKEVRMEQVLQFFETPIGQRFKQAKQLLREVPFTLSRQNEYGIAQIVQGVIDCVFLDGDGQWVLLDYKTDRILPAFRDEPHLTKEMQERYGTQLALYAEALQTIQQIDVQQRVLYLYSVGEIVYVT